MIKEFNLLENRLESGYGETAIATPGGFVDTTERGPSRASSFSDYLKENPEAVGRLAGQARQALNYNPMDLTLSESAAALQGGLDAGLQGIGIGTGVFASGMAGAAAATGIGVIVVGAALLVSSSKRRRAKERERRAKYEAWQRAVTQYTDQLKEHKEATGVSRKRAIKFGQSGQIEQQISSYRADLRAAVAQTGKSFGGASLQERAFSGTELDSLDFILDQSTDKLVGQIRSLGRIEGLIQKEIDATRTEGQIKTSYYDEIKEQQRIHAETY